MTIPGLDPSHLVRENAKKIGAEIRAMDKKLDRLANLDLFILDNSIRESTVGQLRAHTVENKKGIYAQVKKCGMHSIIVASFSHLARVDDEFCQWLKDDGEDFSRLFSFCDVIAEKQVVGGVPDVDAIPIALKKNEKYGLYNTVFEIDLADPDITWGPKWTVRHMCALIENRMDYVFENISKDARILINFRDLPVAMLKTPDLLLSIVEHLATMPKERRMLGVIYEDSTGECFPGQLAAWTRAIRLVMDGCGWTDGRLLNHIHEKWELRTSSTLECLIAGGDGVWGSVCVEGAAMGHACSTVTLMHLVRLGNKKVIETYNCKEFRNAAIEVTKLTTTRKPHPKQCVYGDLALDIVFGATSTLESPSESDKLDLPRGSDFNLPEFFGERAVNRMNTLASPQMVVDRLVFLFGSDPQFTLDMGQDMLAKMLEDLHEGRKEEYQSAMGLSVLFDRSGGQLTSKMSEAVAKVKTHNLHHQEIIAEIKKLWDSWDFTGAKTGCLDFDTFYGAFLASVITCHRCPDTRRALQAMDMDKSGHIDWIEFLVYIKWALAQYPETETADDVLDIALQKGFMPAFRDAKMMNKEVNSGQWNKKPLAGRWTARTTFSARDPDRSSEDVIRLL